MNEQNQKYQKRTVEIVGASTSQPLQPVFHTQNTITEKKEGEKSSPVNSFLGQSEEFKVFWGDHLESQWFNKKRFISPFIIILLLTTALTIYLSGKLLFSPGEFEQLFANIPETTITQLNSNLNTTKDSLNSEETVLVVDDNVTQTILEERNTETSQTTDKISDKKNKKKRK